MDYQVIATSYTPALIIYLLDCSASMGELVDARPKIDHVNHALETILVRMLQRSTKGDVISPRYRLAIVAYSDQVIDVLGGVQSIDKVFRKGKPVLRAGSTADTASAFVYARDLLQAELPLHAGNPAPVVLHLTDGHFTGDDPEPIAHQIMRLSNADGSVLVGNIYFGDDLESIDNIEDWTGVESAEDLNSVYLQKLFRMSSALPETYAEALQADGYSLRAGCRMLLPARHPGLLELGFTMSGATPIREN